MNIINSVTGLNINLNLIELKNPNNIIIQRINYNSISDDQEDEGEDEEEDEEEEDDAEEEEDDENEDNEENEENYDEKKENTISEGVIPPLKFYFRYKFCKTF